MHSRNEVLAVTVAAQGLPLHAGQKGINVHGMWSHRSWSLYTHWSLVEWSSIECAQCVCVCCNDCTLRRMGCSTPPPGYKADDSDTSDRGRETRRVRLISLITTVTTPAIRMISTQQVYHTFM